MLLTAIPVPSYFTDFTLHHLRRLLTLNDFNGDREDARIDDAAECDRLVDIREADSHKAHLIGLSEIEADQTVFFLICPADHIEALNHEPIWQHVVLKHHAASTNTIRLLQNDNQSYHLHTNVGSVLHNPVTLTFRLQGNA